MERVNPNPAPSVPLATVDAPPAAPSPAPSTPPAPPALLPEPAAVSLVGADDSVALAILWVRGLQQDRAASRQLSAAAERRISTANRQEIAARRAQAREEYRASRADAIAKAVGGLTQAAGGMFRKPGEGGLDRGAMVDGGGDIGVAGLQGLAAGHRLGAENHGTDATGAAHAAESASRALDRHRGDAGAASESAGRVLELLRDLLGAQRASEAAAIVRG